jgi:hypothetical protein
MRPPGEDVVRAIGIPHAGVGERIGANGLLVQNVVDASGAAADRYPILERTRALEATVTSLRAHE